MPFTYPGDQSGIDSIRRRFPYEAEVFHIFYEYDIFNFTRYADFKLHDYFKLSSCINCGSRIINIIGKPSVHCLISAGKLRLTSTSFTAYIVVSETDSSGPTTLSEGADICAKAADANASHNHAIFLSRATRSTISSEA